MHCMKLSVLYLHKRFAEQRKIFNFINSFNFRCVVFFSFSRWVHEKEEKSINNKELKNYKDASFRPGNTEMFCPIV